jgi:hypothetical protein
MQIQFCISVFFMGFDLKIDISNEKIAPDVTIDWYVSCIKNFRKLCLTIHEQLLKNIDEQFFTSIFKSL